MSDSPFKRVGVINWDCSMPSETTFFGHYATQSLGPRIFRDRTPYYAIETSPDTIQYKERSVADYEIEMRHAIAAGIDYFAYCWYDRTPHDDHLMAGQHVCVDDKVCELTDARVKHLASPLRDQLGLCAVLITCHPYSTAALEDLVETMKQPFYEKVDGRPLVYMFVGSWQGTLERLCACCAAAGVPEPSAVLMANSILPDDATKVQALCSYAGTAPKTSNWDEFFENEMAGNDYRCNSGIPVIPHFSMGWNPTPRILHPVPWCKYPEGTYAPPATTEQLLKAAARLRSWAEDRRDLCPTGHVLTFAWNEFEEGAWICPTLGPSPDVPDTRFRDTFAQISRLWKT